MLHPFLSHWAMTRGWCRAPTMTVSVNMPSHEVSAHCGIEVESRPVCHWSTQGRQRDEVNTLLFYWCHPIIVVMQISLWHCCDPSLSLSVPPFSLVS